MNPLSRAPAKSALSIQLEEYNEGSAPKMDTASAAAAAASPHGQDPVMISLFRNERRLVRKLSKMISDENWLDMDAFLRSPALVASYRQSFEHSAGCPSPRTHNSALRNRTADTASSIDSLSTGMASLGSSTIYPQELVHYACRFNPPRTIIRHLESLYPESLTTPDNMGRLPLHYAAKWGASYRLIDYLIEKNPTAATVRDSLGRTPLHLLCKSYSSTAGANKLPGDLASDENMVQSTTSLIKAAPDAVNIEDDDGITVIEYAISSNAPYRAVRLIQKASERDWKERKRTSKPGDTHVKIEESIIRNDQQRQKKIVLPPKKPPSRTNFARSA